MCRVAMQDPPEYLLIRLNDVGLVQVEPERKLLALRWTTITYRGGILYASHLPIPWGAYWIESIGASHVVWGYDLETALAVLDAVLHRQ